MIKQFHKIGLLFIGAAFAFSACSEKPDIEHTPTEKMAGEWYTQYFSGGAALTDHHVILTYNTSNPNSNQIWVDDHEIWTFKAKFDVDANSLSFKPMNSTDNVAHTGVTLKVYEGKIIPKAGKSKSGNIVDSIYLKVEFSDDPGTVYEIKGHQRTGFFEDEY
ncbi:MAG TPA: lipid-binding protein [Chitinophagaceae bacterium]